MSFNCLSLLALSYLLSLGSVALPAQTQVPPVSPGAAGANPTVKRVAYVMGTRLVLELFASGREAGLEQSEVLLAVLEAAEEELSTWREDSFLSSLNHTPPGIDLELPSHICGLFRELRQWQRKTDGAFDPAVGALISTWDLRGKGRIPTAREISAALERSGLDKVELSAARCGARRLADVEIDAGAFGKGEALDRARRLSRQQGLSPWLMDFGGQAAVHGRHPGSREWEIPLAAPDDRSEGRFVVRITHGSVATSGSFLRDREVEGRRIGHILDPRTGGPAEFTGSVSVWHPSALVADILSTALFVMGPERGLAWADESGIAVLFQPLGLSNEVLASRSWGELTSD